MLQGTDRWIHDSDLTATLARSRRHGRGLLPLVCVRLVAIPQYVSAPRGPLLVRTGQAQLDQRLALLSIKCFERFDPPCPQNAVLPFCALLLCCPVCHP